MSERIIAKGLTVKCSDGSCHENVMLTVCNGKRIFSDPDGCKLCVELITKGTFNVSPFIYTMIVCNCPMEVD